MSDATLTTAETLTETPTETTEPAVESLLDPAPDAAFDAEKLTLAEGFEKNELYGEFVELAKGAGFSQKTSQSLIDFYSKAAKESADANAAAWQAQNMKWQEEVKADPEVGGNKLPGVLQTISKLLDIPELNGPQLRKDLAFTGAGNLPSMVKFLHKVALRLTEGAAVGGAPPNGAGVRPNIADAMYPGGPRTGTYRME
jgi:hypothetical protein